MIMPIIVLLEDLTVGRQPSQDRRALAKLALSSLVLISLI